MGTLVWSKDLDVESRVWLKLHYSFDLYNTPHTSPWAMCNPSRSAVTHDCREVLSASKELMWTQMATLKPREILRRKARHN
uniref:Uncharacterized protein n=1 Tax=Oryza barthii TaxID=65489 RepID=A0A0D3HL06_9ORYZ